MARSTVLMTAKVAIVSAGLASPAFAQSIVNDGTPAPDCNMRVNVDRNADLPGYRADWDGKRVCLPFMPTNQLVPEGVFAADFYLDQFTDKTVREKWAACRSNDQCREKTLTAAKGFAKFEARDTGRINMKGKIDFEGRVNLADIRRPAFFGQAPYVEPIAEAEGQTYTVEFTVPRDSYEQKHLGLTGEIKLRGWYLKGTGVANEAGQPVRALVVMNNGGSNEITAIDDPRTEAYKLEDSSGKFVENKADTLSEEPGMRHWRGFVHALNAAGFDVLVTDRRGNGVSGGQNGYNTAEQANDIFRELDQIDSGQGLRILSPTNETLEGAAAAGLLTDGAKTVDLPTIVAGYSRGSYATQWFMQKNFVEDCNFDVPASVCVKPRGRTNIKGAILYGPNSAGLGYRMAGHDAIEGALREEFSTTYYPDSGLLAHIDKWPAVQIVKGTWDYVEGLEGSFEAYRRARGLKDISVFLGPHQLATQNESNMRFAGERMVAFAKAAVLGADHVEGSAAPQNLRDLVLSAPHNWEKTTDPEAARDGRSK